MFDKKDQIHQQNLQRLLIKAKMELEGQEILAAADVLRWVVFLGQKIEEDLKRQEIQAQVAAGEEKIVVPEASPVTQSLPDKPKKASKSSNG